MFEFLISKFFLFEWFSFYIFVFFDRYVCDGIVCCVFSVLNIRLYWKNMDI